MSKVPPSPAHASTVVRSRPSTRRAARMPAAVEAAVSKAVWYTGTLRAVWGNGPEMTDQQQAGISMMVSGPSAFRA